MRPQLNIVKRLQQRELGRIRPGAQAVNLRSFYENIVPSTCIANVEYPPHICARRWSSDGSYLICFNRSLQSVAVYRFCWPTSSREDVTRERDGRFETYFTLVYEKNLAGYPEVLCKDFCLMTEGDRFMILASSVPANTGGAHLPPVADQTRVVAPGAREPQVNWVPRLERITFYLVGLADGVEYDRRVFLDDYIVLQHHAGVHLYQDAFAVLSVRYQAIHIMHVRETGSLVDVRVVGPHCYEDDDLFLACQRDAEAAFTAHAAADGSGGPAACGGPEPAQSSSSSLDAGGQGGYANLGAGSAYPLSFRASVARLRPEPTTGFGPGPDVVSPIHAAGPSSAHGAHAQQTHPPPSHPPHPPPHDGPSSPSSPSSSSSSFSSSSKPLVTGVKQRILAHLFRQSLNPGLTREQRLQAQRNFHCHSAQYESLVMWRFQFLDGDHVLLKLIGPPDNPARAVEAGAHWNAAAFFVVYNVRTTRVMRFLHNTSDDLFALYETHQDFFRARSPSSPTSGALSVGSIATNGHLRELHRAQRAVYAASARSAAGSFARRHLSMLPCAPQNSCESPLLDPALFTYDDRLVSHGDSFQCRSYQCLEYPVKFLSRRTGAIRFKIHPGPTSPRSSPRNKRWLSYLFHPALPFVISIQHSPMHPSVLNVHFRR